MHIFLGCLSVDRVVCHDAGTMHAANELAQSATEWDNRDLRGYPSGFHAESTLKPDPDAVTRSGEILENVRFTNINGLVTISG